MMKRSGVPHPLQPLSVQKQRWGITRRGFGRQLAQRQGLAQLLDAMEEHYRWVAAAGVGHFASLAD
jgi:hypothetical protein